MMSNVPDSGKQDDTLILDDFSSHKNKSIQNNNVSFINNAYINKNQLEYKY